MRNKLIAIGLGIALVLGSAGAAFAANPNAGQKPTTPYKACATLQGVINAFPSRLGVCPVNSNLVTINPNGGAQGTPGVNGTNGTNGANGSVGPVGPAGTNGTDGINGKNGHRGRTGATGKTGAVGPAELESWESCVPSLCIDTPPAGGGSGGWGWNPEVGNVTSLNVGDIYPFTVTAIQNGPEYFTGTVTLTWNPNDFNLIEAAGFSFQYPLSVSPGSDSATFTYGAFSHVDKSVSFSFEALNDNPSALVTATVTTGGHCVDGGFVVNPAAVASETFSVAIVGSAA
jgi:hypothetical protein